MPSNWFSFRHLFNFSWRASRREFWLIHVLGYFAIMLPMLLPMAFLDPIEPDAGVTAVETLPFLAFMAVAFILQIATLIVMLAATVRRMHDQEKSAWWILLCFIPLIGWIFSLIYIFTPGDEGENLYGPDPREGARPERVQVGDLEKVFD